MAFMSDVPNSLKAIALGFITIILIGFALSFFSYPLETFIGQQFFAQPESREELLKAIVWPSTIAISFGIFIAFSCGGFVTSRMTDARPLLCALLPVLIFAGFVWAPVLIRGFSNHLTPWIYSLVSLFSAFGGSLLGMRRASVNQ